MVLWWAAFVVFGLLSPPTRPFAWIAFCLAGTLSVLVLSLARRRPGPTAATAAQDSVGRAAAYCTIAVVAAIILWEGAGIERRTFDARAAPVAGRPASDAGRANGRGAPVSAARSRDEGKECALPVITRLRERLIESLDDGRLSRPAKGIVGALVLDYRRDLGFSLNETYNYLGITHFLALSGMHLGVIAVPLAKILSLLFRSRNGRDAALFSVLCFYAAVAAFPPSLSRALALSAAVIAYRLLGVSSGLITALVGGCFVLVLCDPSVAFDAGFQLSFAAVCGIALIGIPLSRMIDAVSPDGVRGTALKALVFPALITCSVQFLTMPLTIILFKRASLISPLVNVIVSLPFTVLLYLGVAYVFVPFGPLRMILAFPVNLICRFLDVVPSAFSRGPHPAVYSGDFDFMLYLAGVGFVAWALKRTGRARLLCVFAGAVFVAVSFAVRAGPGASGPDVARGGDTIREMAASVSVRGASYVSRGEGILVVDEAFATGDAYRLTRRLWGEGVREIELCVVTSPRLGRANGLRYLARRVAVRELLCSPYLSLSERNLETIIGGRATAVRCAARGDTLFTRSFVVEVVGPSFPPPRGASIPADSLRLRCRIAERARLTSGRSANSMLTVH